MVISWRSEPRRQSRGPGWKAWFAVSVSLVCCAALTGARAQQGNGESPSVHNTPQRSAVPAPADVAAPPPGSQKTASGIFMKVLTPGKGTEHAAGNDCLRARFTAWKRDGSLFSTSGVHQETVVQCLNTMIPGLVEAFEKMAPGEKRRVWVPASLAFGKKHRHGGGLIAWRSMKSRLQMWTLHSTSSWSRS